MLETTTGILCRGGGLSWYDIVACHCERIICSLHQVDCVINFTAGMGGDLTFTEEEWGTPSHVESETDLCGPMKRLEHIIELKPEICTLDCGSLNWGLDGNCVVVNSCGQLRKMAEKVGGVERVCEW